MANYNLQIPEATIKLMLSSLLAAEGVIMGDGAGNIFPAEPGEDIPYPILSGANAPTPSTVGSVGQFYVATNPKYIFRCDAVSGGAYIWNLYGGGGGGGTGFVIKGYYATLAALEAAVPNPEVGDAYGVGTTPPYDIYVFDGVTHDWKNNGPISGASTTDELVNASDVEGATASDALNNLDEMKQKKITYGDEPTDPEVGEIWIDPNDHEGNWKPEYDAGDIEYDSTETYDQGSIGNAVKGLSSQIGNLQTAEGRTRNMISDAWTQKTYQPGEYAIYNNKLWRCKVANSSAPSEGANWTEVSVTDQINSITPVISDTAFSSANPNLSIEYARLLIIQRIAFFGIRCNISGTIPNNSVILNVNLPYAASAQSVHMCNRTDEIFDTPIYSKNIRSINTTTSGTLILSGMIFLT